MMKWGPTTEEGVVIDINQMQNVDRGIKAGQILQLGVGAAMLPIKPLAGIMSLTSAASRPKEYKTIYTLRIRTSSNEIREIRIDRDMIGASINLHDYISVWGRDTGVINMARGYNHTIKGEISLK